jgi:hypothetical protein
MKTLVVLAAGIGSRYGGLKQMDPVGPGGEFILDYSVYDALSAGFGRVVFVVRGDILEPFRAAIGSRLARHVPVACACQELEDLPAGFAVPPGRTKPWGTGQAVLAAAAHVDGPFAAINADDFYGRPAYVALSRFLDDTADDPAAWAMVGFVLRNTLSEHGSVARGICRADADGWLQRIDETVGIETRDGAIREPGGPLSGDEVVSMNFWGFKPGVFAELRRRFEQFLALRGNDPRAEFYLPMAVQDMVAAGTARVRVLRTDSTWIGVTNRADRDGVVQAIGRLVRNGEYPARLWG